MSGGPRLRSAQSLLRPVPRPPQAVSAAKCFWAGAEPPAHPFWSVRSDAELQSHHLETAPSAFDVPDARLRLVCTALGLVAVFARRSLDRSLSLARASRVETATRRRAWPPS